MPQTILRSAADRARDAEERRQALTDLPLFQGLREADLEEVSARASTRTVTPGHCVYRCGEPVAALFLVLRGELEALRPLEDGGEHRLGLLRPGDIFGEAALLEDRPHRSEVRAVEESTVVAIPRQHLDTFFSRHPSRRLRLRTLAVTRRLAKVSGAFTD